MEKNNTEIRTVTESELLDQSVEQFNKLYGEEGKRSALADAGFEAVFELGSFYSIAKAHKIKPQSLHRFIKNNRVKHKESLAYSCA